MRRGLGPVQLAAGAAWTLGGNDIGTMITAAPRLYPHMWSWDAAFIVIGLAYLNIDRAVRELETLLGAQWRNGMLPHIVFSEGTDYFPGPDRWGTAELNPDAPTAPRTSGICQPPVHAIALRRMVDVGRRGSAAEVASVERLLRESWPHLYRWHDWLARHRDPHGTGLLAVVHGWESGMDKSPCWDEPYAAVRPGPDLPPYERTDRRLVADARERPSDAEYDRYLWLIEEMRRARTTPARSCAPRASWSPTCSSAPCSGWPARCWSRSARSATSRRNHCASCDPGPPRPGTRSPRAATR